MGSRIVTALVEQRGRLTTNPGGLSPNPSTPIEQVGDKQAISESLVQQIGPFRTASISGQSTSLPVLQHQAPIANDDEGNDEAIIEQKSAGTAASALRSEEAYDSPVLQVAFNNRDNLAQDATVSKPMEQKNVSRSSDNNPIEQKPPVSNQTSVEQFNFIELVFPVCGSIKNPVDTDLLWRIRDFGFTFNAETLIFKVNGVEVQDASSFSITDLGNGLELFYNPSENFDFSALVEIFVQISDTAVPPNTFSARCSFSTVPDTKSPIVSNVIPCGQTGVDVLSPIEFDIVDNGEGVDINTLVISVEGLPVCSGISIDPITTASGNGFHVIWEHPESPFRYGATISLAVEASDLADNPNSSLYLCCFDTAESTPPDFINFNPEPCSSFVDADTGLTFEVYGNVDGVDISTLEVRVDNQLRKVIVRPRVIRSQ